MMKLKKIIAAAASVVMVCVFATSAFAATYDEMRAKVAARYPAYADVINGLTDAQVQAVSNSNTFEQATAKADATLAEVKANPSNANAIVQRAVSTIPNLVVSDVTVNTAADGSVSVSAKVVNTDAASPVYNQAKTVSATVVAASEHPEIGEAIKNGTWGVDEKKATAASATVSAPSAVIKATGDNTAVVLMMGALAIVGVLGLAVRKSDAEA